MEWAEIAQQCSQGKGRCYCYDIWGSRCCLSFSVGSLNLLNQRREKKLMWKTAFGWDVSGHLGKIPGSGRYRNLKSVQIHSIKKHKELEREKYTKDIKLNPLKMGKTSVFLSLCHSGRRSFREQQKSKQLRNREDPMVGTCAKSARAVDMKAFSCSGDSITMWFR